MDIKAVARRLDALQREAGKSRPCRMTVTFADGHCTAIDPCGLIDLCREQGSNIANISADRPEYHAMAAILTVLCHPAAERRLTDFEQSN